MRDKEQGTKIIFVRHGMTDFPKDRLYCDDREDPVLNEHGVKQAQMAANMLADEQVDFIFSSPLKRAMMTAEAIAGKNRLRLQTNSDLKERPFGIWDGMYFAAIERDFPGEYQAWKKNPDIFVPEGGESIHALLARVKKAVDDIVLRHHGKTVVIVTHVGPIRVMVSHSLNMPLQGYRQLTIDYGSLTRIDYGMRQNNLVYLNRFQC